MLELAKKRKIYKRHMCEYLGPKKLDIDDGTLKLMLNIGLVFFSLYSRQTHPMY